MSSSRRTCCIDANILFDFAAGEIFDSLFLLPFDFHTSDIVAYEISGSYSTDELTRAGIRILALDETEVLEVYLLKQDHLDLSLQDVSVFFLGLKRSMMILSNDSPLRELANDYGIEYHGTLWLMEELVRRKILTRQDAITALKRMLGNKRWLPRAECNQLIKKWESEK